MTYGAVYFLLNLALNIRMVQQDQDKDGYRRGTCINAFVIKGKLKFIRQEETKVNKVDSLPQKTMFD